jgi:hypothetical protein
MYTSIKVMVAPADGYTSGQALKAIEEVAGTTLPTGFGYELGGMAREEAETSGSTTGLIFLLCFVFVYLLLSAQYESYILPLAVLLSIPFGLMGSFLFVQGWAALGNIPALKMILGTMSNNIYMQIALIMLVGVGEERHPDRRVCPRPSPYGYEYHVGCRFRCCRSSTSYPDDIVGYGSRSVAYDVRVRCRCSR